jgi:nucleotide-binding universal stress UspA family protein
MSTIVCPVDFKTSSFHAARIAAIMAKSTQAKLLFVHSVTEEESQVRERLQAGMDRLGFHVERIVGEQFGFILSQKGLVETIREIGKTEDIGLVVMATDGISGLKEFYQGTHTENVAAKTPYNVLVLPTSFNKEGFAHVVCATDYEPGTKNDIEGLLLLTKAFKGTLDMLHVSLSDSEVSRKIFEGFSKEMHGIFGYDDLRINRMVDIHVDDALISFAVERNADLIALHKSHFKINDGSKTDTLLRMSEFPLLLLRD